MSIAPSQSPQDASDAVSMRDDLLHRPRAREDVEAELRALVAPRLILTLTHNRRTMLSQRHQGGVLYVRAHSIFRFAPPEILATAARVLRGSADRDDRRTLQAFCRRRGERPTEPCPSPVVRPEPLTPHGEIHDLLRIWNALNDQWFQSASRATITWGRNATRRRKHSIQLGSYDLNERLIRVHPVLDQTWVPQYVVTSVVFHEMLHEKHGALWSPTGWRTHTPAFRAEERSHPDFERARAWEARNLSRLLRCKTPAAR